MTKERIPLGWAGIDVGNGHHWICLIDEAGTTVWSAKVITDEATILDAIGVVLACAEEVLWGVDVTGTMSRLLLAPLAAHGQPVRYVPGRTVNQMASAYRGEAKTDARDAYVIAETLRHRGGLQEVEVAASRDLAGGSQSLGFTFEAASSGSQVGGLVKVGGLGHGRRLGRPGHRQRIERTRHCTRRRARRPRAHAHRDGLPQRGNGQKAQLSCRSSPRRLEASRPE